VIEDRLDRQPAHELAFEPELDQVLALTCCRMSASSGRGDPGSEADTLA